MEIKYQDEYKIKCPLCATECKVIGKESLHFESIAYRYRTDLERLQIENESLKQDVKKLKAASLNLFHPGIKTECEK